MSNKIKIHGLGSFAYYYGSIKRSTLFVSIAIAVAFFVQYGCNQGSKGTVTATDTNYVINFSPTPPSDLDTGADPKKLAEFAWEEFLALNWKSSYNKDQRRGTPDTTWNYNTESGAYPDLDVWETYGHRTELRPFSNKMLPFNNAPHYSFGDNIQPASPAASFALFNNLDENNEIGSCDMYTHVNVFKKQYQVLYEAKVNSEEYNYILNNYPTKQQLLKATSATMANIATDTAYFPGGKTTCGCPVGVICLPCGGGKSTGTIEIKAAWRRLTNLDDSTKFFTRKVIYYTKDKAGKIFYNNATYALIALHIIHKTQNYPAFVFATFEHVDVQKDSMGYVLLNGAGIEHGKLMTPMQDPILPATAGATNYVHQKLPKKSIWQNYRLVGVQSKPSSDSTSTPNFFLSNYVVESDYTLNHFNGSGIGTPHNHLNNLLYKGKFLSMGGCQGCHGVAQKTLGTDFSFLLDTVGKPVVSPDISNVNNAPKLMRYINEIKRAHIQIAKLTAKK
jgi:hypothetical protein